MSDADSEDERMGATMANWEREDDDGGTDKKKSKKKKKKKDKKSKGEAEEVEDGEAPAEKKDKKKKKKSKDKDRKEKSRSKDKDDAPPSPTKKSKKKSKDKKNKEKKKDKEKDKEKDKDKKSKKKKRKDASEEPAEEPAEEPGTPAPPAPVVLDPVDYVADDDGNASETSEDRKMKELLQQWDEDGDEDSDSASASDEGDEEEAAAFEVRRMTKAELGLEDNALDHVVLAAPDFAEAMKEFESMTGIKPSVGGSLKGLGTRTARVGLDNQAYIEIIAPDPKQSGPIGEQLMNLEEGSLVPIHYAIRQTDLSDLADDYVPNELGYDPDRIAMFRAGPDGSPRKWEMLFMHGHFHGGTVPYFVDWGECEHPIGAIAQVGSLKNFVVSCPAGSKVHELLKGIKDIKVVDGELGLEFSFGSPEGTITFAGDKPRGLKFPGYEEKKAAGQIAADDEDDEDESNEDDEDEDDDDSEDDDDDDDDDDESEAEEEAQDAADEDSPDDGSAASDQVDTASQDS